MLPVILAMVTAGASARAGTRQSFFYSGITGQNAPMSFEVDYDPGTHAFYVNRTTFEVNLHCPSGQFYLFDTTFNSGARIVAGRFLARNVYPKQQDGWVGRFTSLQQARGSAHFEVPALTPGGDIERCAATLGWFASLSP